MFKIKSDFKPAGDQPEAIDKLVHGLEEGQKFQTLLGVTRFTEKLLRWQMLSKRHKGPLLFLPITRL